MNNLDVQYGISAEADFEKGTWTFEMPERYHVSAGEFALVKRSVFDAIVNDVKEAAGELMVEIPAPNTDAAKMLHANVMLRKYKLPRLEAEASLYKHLLREVCVRASLNFPETVEEVQWQEEGVRGELMLDIAAALQLGEVEEQQIHKNRERFEQLLKKEAENG